MESNAIKLLNFIKAKEISVEEVQKQYDIFKKQDLIFYTPFESLHWEIFNPAIKTKTIIHFELLSNIEGTIVLLLKQWCLEMLNEGYSVDHVKRNIAHLVKAINGSNNFDINYISKFEDLYFTASESSKTLYMRSNSLIKFFDFIELELEDPYTELIYENYNKNLNFEMSNREIPSTKDALKFSLILNDYFQNIGSTGQYLKFFPVLLWWQLTSIIPIRAKEFCLIPRNGLIIQEDKYYLKIPRSKHHKNRAITFDEISIPKSLGKEIEKYITLTNGFEESETLINYLSTRYDFELNTYKTIHAEYHNFYGYNSFAKLLIAFYKEIVRDTYGYTLVELLGDEQSLSSTNVTKTISRMLRPNDTRHIAFINLMLQGVHPSEIARLGGHTNIHSQYSYQNHLTHWVDSDLVSLLTIQSKEIDNMSGNLIPHMNLQHKIVPNEWVEETKIELNVGYCNNSLQPCRVDDCFLCEHWRITREDWIKNNKVIDEKIKLQEDLFKSLLRQLFDLYKLLSIETDDAPKSLIERNELSSKSKEVQESLFKLSLLKK